MPVFTARYRRQAPQYADRDFEAETPVQALALAQAYVDESDSYLEFEDCGGGETDEIEILQDNDQTGQEWISDDLRLSLAAHQLLAALSGVLEKAKDLLLEHGWEHEVTAAETAIATATPAKEGEEP
jgi:hypothetical protein